MARAAHVLLQQSRQPGGVAMTIQEALEEAKRRVHSGELPNHWSPAQDDPMAVWSLKVAALRVVGGHRQHKPRD